MIGFEASQRLYEMGSPDGLAAARAWLEGKQP